MYKGSLKKKKNKSNGECKLAIQGCGSKSQCPVPAAGFLRVKLCCLSTGRGAVVTEAVFSSGFSIGDW